MRVSLQELEQGNVLLKRRLGVRVGEGERERKEKGEGEQALFWMLLC